MSKHRLYGAVVVFPDGTEPHLAEQLLRDLAKKAGRGMEAPRVETFDPAYGSPVWYIP